MRLLLLLGVVVAVADRTSSSSRNVLVGNNNDWNDLETPATRDGNVYVMDSISQLQQTLQQQQQHQQSNNDSFWLVHLQQQSSTDADSCTFSLSPVVHEAADRLSILKNNDTNNSMTIRVATLSLSTADWWLLQQPPLGLEATPAIVLVSSSSSNHDDTNKQQQQQQQQQYIMVEYTGLYATAQQLVEGVTHYFTSLRLLYPDNNSHPLLTDSTAPPPKLRAFASLEELRDFLLLHPQLLLQSTRMPVLSQRESPIVRAYVSWLFQQDDDDDEAEPLTTRLVVQYRTQTTDSDDDSSQRQHQSYYNDFDVFARTQASRRDCLFLVIQNNNVDSNQENGRVDVWEISKEATATTVDWLSQSPRYRYTPVSDELPLLPFLVRAVTPTLLWWDRQTTAPIAFGRHRQVHAVLVVDVPAFLDEKHDNNNNNNKELWDQDHAHWRAQRDAVRQFRAACRGHHKNNDNDLVCLVVPRTEIRVLTTFGIDWWAPMDRRAFAGDDDEDEQHDDKIHEPLPALFVTDQRYSGTRRYYYDDSDDENNNYNAFLTAFWEGRLPYEVKTSPRKSRTNQSGVRILTAESFDTELFANDSEQEEQQQHALILFTAPTCGHCKRLLVIWNHLARLLQHIGWNAFLTLYQVDVTENDIATTLNVTVQWLPDVYYLHNSKTNNRQQHEFIRYNHTDAMGEGIGAVRDGTEILEWLVHLEPFADAERASQLLSQLEPQEEG